MEHSQCTSEFVPSMQLIKMEKANIIFLIESLLKDSESASTVQRKITNLKWHNTEPANYEGILIGINCLVFEIEFAIENCGRYRQTWSKQASISSRRYASQPKQQIDGILF